MVPARLCVIGFFIFCNPHSFNTSPTSTPSVSSPHPLFPLYRLADGLQGIQENVGTLDSRVTLLETGGVLDKPKTHFKSELSPTNSAPTTSTGRAEDSTPEASFSLENDFAAENEEMATQQHHQQQRQHHHHHQHRDQPTPPRTSTSSPRDFIVDPSSRASFGGDEFSSDGNLLPERNEVDGSACDVDLTDEGPLTPLAIKLFAPPDETPTNSLSPDNQIPYISR